MAKAPQPIRNTAGHDALWNWFGLGRPSWLTMPRVLMHAMPDEWQAKMAQLLHEYDEAFPNMPDVGTRVQVTTLAGKLIKTPAWLVNYRHPDRQAIAKLRVSANRLHAAEQSADRQGDDDATQ